MSVRLPRRFWLYLRYLPCHPTLRRGDAEWAELWRARSGAVFKRLPFWVACLAVAVSVFAWPVVVVNRSWRLSGREAERDSFGWRERISFFVRLVALSLRHRLSPVDCLHFDLLAGNRSATLCRNYVSESLALPLLAARNEREGVDMLGNKRRFHEHLGNLGVAVAPNLAFAGKGAAFDESFFRNCREDVFFKPVRGSRSEGVERWDWSESGFRKAYGDAVYSPERLAQHLRELSQSRDYLVQPRLWNHAELEDLANGSVIVFRALSVRFGGKVEIIAPVAQLPCETVVGEAWRERVVQVAVDLESGVLRSILGKGGAFVESGACPLERATILGRVVPDWAAGMDLLRRGHEALPGVALIGWDLVFTPAGPKLIEGNSGPALVPHQLPPLGPLRETALWDALCQGGGFLEEVF